MITFASHLLSKKETTVIHVGLKIIMKVSGVLTAKYSESLEFHKLITLRYCAIIIYIHMILFSLFTIQLWIPMENESSFILSLEL